MFGKSIILLHQRVRSSIASKCYRSTFISSSRYFSATVNPAKDESKNPQSSNQESNQESQESGFNIFEQLKAQKNQKMEQDDFELNEKEKERIKRQQESAEREINEKQAKTFGAGSALLALGSIALYAFLGLKGDKDVPVDGESELSAHNRRAMAAASEYYNYWTEPPTTKLLPDPLPAPYQRPLTLCIELNDSLVHLVWDKSVGWRVATRPGVKQFLANLSRYYEIVIFTTQPGYLAEPVNAALDPFQYAMYRLYRDHTKLVKGQYIKDVSNLNRDLGKVVMVDVNPEAYSLQPENGLKLKKWTGESGDAELMKFQTFLEELYLLMSMMGSQDVRPFLKVLHKINKDDPAAAWETHKENLRRELEKNQVSSPSQQFNLLGYVTSMFGFGSRSKSAPSNPKNIIDLLEKVAKEEREAFAKEQEQNKAQLVEMQRQHEEAIKKQIEENKSKNLKLFDYFMGAGQPQPPAPQQA